MSNPFQYTPEEKSRFEIEKLHAEVSELRSWTRRWLGSLGGFVGIITAAVSVIVTTQQWQSAASATSLERQKLEADKAEFAKVQALDLEEKSKQRNQKMDAEIAAKNSELTEKDKAVRDKTTELIALEQKFGDEQARAAQRQEDKEAAERLLKARKEELDALQTQIAQLAASLRKSPGQTTAATSATAIADSARTLINAAHRQLIDDNQKARIFIFVADEGQRDPAWQLEAPLRAKDFFVANVILHTGGREETPVLRYFRPEDNKEATRIREALTELKVPNVRVSYVIDPDSVGTGRKYQLWLRKENLSMP